MRLDYRLDLARTKKTARVDGPWPGPIFSLVQPGMHIESLASVSDVLGEPHPALSESEFESNPVVVEMEEISYDWVAQNVRSVKSQYPPDSVMSDVAPLVGSD